MNRNKKTKNDPVDFFSVQDLPAELGEILIRKLDKINTSDSLLEEKIEKIVKKANPIDLASVACYYSDRIVSAIYNALPAEKEKSEFLKFSESSVVQCLIKNLSISQIYAVISEMDPDEISDIFEHLEKKEIIKLKKSLDKIDPRKKHKIRAILSHSEHAIARFMSTQFLSLGIDATVQEAIEEISISKEDEVYDSVFITSEFGELLGKVNVLDILKNNDKKNIKLRNLPNSPTYRLFANDTREVAVGMSEHLDDYGSIPVIDYSGSLVGVVLSSTMVEIIKDISQDTLGAIGGAEEHEDENSATEKILSRIPWLFMTFASGMLSATAINTFSNMSRDISFTISFIPLITGMTGNIGIQSSTVIVRGMAVSGWSASKAKKRMWKESFTGGIIGLFFGITVGTIIFLIQLMSTHRFNVSPSQVGFTIGSGLFLSSIWSSLLGVIAPSFFSYIGVDPAISAGPMVTALNDVVAMIIYLMNALFINSIWLHLTNVTSFF